MGESPFQSRGNCGQAGAVERSCSGPITAAPAVQPLLLRVGGVPILGEGAQCR